MYVGITIILAHLLWNQLVLLKSLKRFMMELMFVAFFSIFLYFYKQVNKDNVKTGHCFKMVT